MKAPATGRITKAFGRQKDGSFHSGTDRGWLGGRTVSAMMAGEVTGAGFLPDYGLFVRVFHGYDTEGRVIESRYCHLSKITVDRGRVEEGEQVGVMGSTGSLAKGVHLHSELIVDGIRRDETTFEFTMPTLQQNKDTDMRIIYNTDNTNDDTRRALVGEMSFQVITAGQSTREGKLWGATVNFTQGEWDNCLLLVTQRRAAVGLPVTSAGGGSGLTVAEHNQLFDIPNKAETAALHTTQTGDINAHTTSAVNGITLTAAP